MRAKWNSDKRASAASRGRLSSALSRWASTKSSTRRRAVPERPPMARSARSRWRGRAACSTRWSRAAWLSASMRRRSAGSCQSRAVTPWGPGGQGGVLAEDALLQRDGPRLGVQQAHDAVGPGVVREIEVDEAQRPGHVPARLVLGGQDAVAAGVAGVARRLDEVGVVPALEVDRQGVVAGLLVVHAAAMVAPLHQAQAIGEGQLTFATRVGAAQHVEDGLVGRGAGGEVEHAAMLGQPAFPASWRGRRCAGICNRAVGRRATMAA